MRHAFVLALFVFASLATAQDSYVPRKDAEWTIHCQTFSGPDHVRQAKRAKADLVKSSGMRDWYVIYGENESKLYYGAYVTIEEAIDPAESARVKRDLQKIESLSGGNGEHPFARAMIVEINPPDPTGPPEWNLANLNRNKRPDDPTRAYFTLQVGAYKDSPQRKQFAVDAARAARAKGIEAFYYHGDTVSSVCVGAWPRSAVKEQEQATGGAANADQKVFVSNTPLSPQALQQLRKQNPELPDTVLEPKFEPSDPTLIKAMQDFPYHEINGQTIAHRRQDAQTGQMVLVPEPSSLMLVPDAPPSLLDMAQQPVPPPDPRLARPATPSGTGGLKSLGQ